MNPTTHISPRQASLREATASAVQAVVFKLGNELYALPAAEVREVVRMQPITPLPKAPAFLVGVIDLRGRVVPVMDLRKQFERPAGATTDRARILIARLPSATRRRGWVGLIVDGVEEVASIPHATIQPPPEFVTSQLRENYLAGIARVGSNLVLLLNAQGLLTPEHIQQLELNLWLKS